MALPLSPSSGIALSDEMILHKAGVKSLHQVRRVNFWREHIENIWAIRHLQQVESISLVSNLIKVLRPFAACCNLQELYLRNNQISSLNELQALRNLHHLKILWLMGNPCTSKPHYRAFAIYCSPSLSNLDDVEVTDAEREAANRQMTPTFVLELLAASGKTDPQFTITVPRSAPPPTLPPAPLPSVQSAEGQGSLSQPASLTAKKMKEPRSASATLFTNKRVSPKGTGVASPPSASTPGSVASSSSAPSSRSSRLRTPGVPSSSISPTPDTGKDVKGSGGWKEEVTMSQTTTLPLSKNTGPRGTTSPLGTGLNEETSHKRQKKSFRFLDSFTVRKGRTREKGNGTPTPLASNSGEQQVLLSSIRTLLPLLSRESLGVVQNEVQQFLKTIKKEEERDQK